MMVMNITEYDNNYDQDMTTFILFDTNDNLFYVYGSREGSKYVKYTKTFDNINTLYNFIYLSMALSEKHQISISVNYIEGLTNYDEFNEINEKITRYNEIVAYDNIDGFSKKDFRQYVNAFLL
jgi:ribosomal protein S2